MPDAAFTLPTVSPVILPVTSPVTLPIKLGAVTIPVALIFPTELIPTPFSQASTLLTTLKVLRGSSDQTPTFPHV